MSDGMDGEFSRLFKERMIENRHNDFGLLKSWLKEKSINFTEYTFNIVVNDMKIYHNMKVSFGSGLKRYQYNLKGLKDRILKTQ